MELDTLGNPVNWIVFARRHRRHRRFLRGDSGRRLRRATYIVDFVASLTKDYVQPADRTPTRLICSLAPTATDSRWGTRRAPRRSLGRSVWVCRHCALAAAAAIVSGRVGRPW